MKKLLKTIVLAAAAAALTATAALAAEGWTFENNQWVFYQNDSKVYNTWKASSDGKYYYLGDDGGMVKDRIVDESRYADSDGSMVTNAWRQIDGKWYYFDGNGKMLMNRARQVNGIWYYFSEDGSMATGWVNDQDNYYYCDPEAGGRMVTSGWKQLEPAEDMYVDYQGTMELAETGGTYWFYFQSSGKLVRASDYDSFKEQTIGGNKYAFDYYGRMCVGWVKLADTTPAIAGYKYYNDSASIGTYGAAHTGWLSAYPPETQEFGTDVQWFYFDAVGKPTYGKTISEDDSDETLNARFKRLTKNGVTRTYLFNEYGNPVYGLRRVERSNGVQTSMYFGTKTESYLQLGEKNITEADGTVASYLFDTNGYGYNGVHNGKLYYMGKLQKAYDSAYAYYQVNETVWLVNKSGSIVKNHNKNKKSDEVDFRSDANGRRDGGLGDVSDLQEPVFFTSEY